MANACGKVILCGEHAVVYGQDAIAVGLPEGVRATAIAADEFGLRVNDRELSHSDLSVEALTQLHAAIALRTSPAKVHVTVAVSMPLGVGLGGSAAMGVAIAKALASLCDRRLELSELLEMAAIWERVFHGNPSGVDAATAALGGCLRFNRHTGTSPVPLRNPLHLALAVAGPPSLTKVMVAQVAEHRQRDAARFERTLGAIQTIVAQAEICLRAGELERLGELLTANHHHLCSWDLSTPAIEEACKLALEAGALGAKLTGAGGGGCVLALCTPSTRDAVQTIWQNKNFSTLNAVIS
jgi:mevalonate kinase